MSAETEWLDYALSMADEAGRGSHSLSLVATRLEGLPIDADVEGRLRTLASQATQASEADLPRATRALYAELAHWLLEFMVAASYVRQDPGLTVEEIAVACGRWFERLGQALSERERTACALAILVKSLLNDARPYLVCRTTGGGVTLEEAPLLIRVEHGLYHVTDEAENYLYHLDSTIDAFAADYSLVAARMGRELDARSYDKSSRTVKDMIAKVGHVRRQMATFVEEVAHLTHDEQQERFEQIRASVDAVRQNREAVGRYQDEVARIWRSWTGADALDLVRERQGERLRDLRSLEEGLRVLTAVQSWMIDEHARLADRIEEVERHYLRSSIVTTLFSPADLIEEVAREDVYALDWLDALLLPATRPRIRVDFQIPPLVTLDDMPRTPAPEEAESPKVDLEDLIAGDEDAERSREDASALELASRFAAWLASGAGMISEWLGEQDPEDIHADMANHDLTRLVSSLLGDTKSVRRQEGGRASVADDATLAGFADVSWLSRALPEEAEGIEVTAHLTGEETPYLGTDGMTDVHGLIDDVRFEVSVHAREHA